MGYTSFIIGVDIVIRFIDSYIYYYHLFIKYTHCGVFKWDIDNCVKEFCILRYDIKILRYDSFILKIDLFIPKYDYNMLRIEFKVLKIDLNIWYRHPSLLLYDSIVLYTNIFIFNKDLKKFKSECIYILKALYYNFITLYSTYYRCVEVVYHSFILF